MTDGNYDAVKAKAQAKVKAKAKAKKGGGKGKGTPALSTVVEVIEDTPEERRCIGIVQFPVVEAIEDVQPVVHAIKDDPWIADWRPDLKDDPLIADWRPVQSAVAESANPVFNSDAHRRTVEKDEFVRNGWLWTTDAHAGSSASSSTGTNHRWQSASEWQAGWWR